MSRIIKSMSLSFATIRDNLEKGIMVYPEWQRKTPAWNLEQKQEFIDTIFSGYSGIIPPILIGSDSDPTAVEWGDNPSIIRISDGKQRIDTIQSFIDNKFRIWASSKKEYVNKKFNELSLGVRDVLLHFTFDAKVLIGFSLAEEKLIFRRLQNGTVLRPAEKRRSFNGILPDYINKLSIHPLFTDKINGNKKAIAAFTNAHGSHEDTCSQVYVFIYDDIGGRRTFNTSTRYIDRMYRFFETSESTLVHTIPPIINRIFDYIYSAFSEFHPLTKLSKLDVIILSMVLYTLFKKYNIEKYKKQFCDIFMDLINEPSEEARLYRSHRDVSNPGTKEKMFQVMMMRTLCIENFPAERDPLRKFTEDMKSQIIRRDQGICQLCLQPIQKEEEYAFHHYIYWILGGATIVDNGRLVHKECHTELHKNDYKREVFVPLIEK